MFINLSNHPSSKWSDGQLAAARELSGQIVDIPFPVIAPEANRFEVANLALEYLDKILKLAPKDGTIVHLMGEQSFCFSLTNLLREHQIQVVVSTTGRKVMEENGVKTSVFSFVQFRPLF